MDNKSFASYHVANISKDDVTTITNLEKQLSENTNKPIVLIAYQPNDESQSEM
ncbi:MAG: hypothetical protein K0S61_3272 [Anaerocolumna sp.]|jgi:hypothetical protein|nr:hypothetical protein [Anaerocolumna sp.]